MFKHIPRTGSCSVVGLRLPTGGEFLLWAAGTERPDEGLGELFAGRDGMVFCGGVGSDDKPVQMVVDPAGEARGRCALTLYECAAEVPDSDFCARVFLASAQRLQGSQPSEDAPQILGR
jgi:hypothetical protein